MKKIILILFILLPCLILQAQTDSTNTISIAAVGDIMMGTDYPKNRLPADDGSNLMADVEHILKSADLTFGNLEGILLDGGKPEKECSDPTKCYIFRTPTRYIKNLTNAGFDILSLANNHAFDFGRAGVDTTKKILDSVSIKHSGERNSFAIWQHKNLTIGFMAFAPNRGCNHLLNLTSAKSYIKRLNKECDIVIVSFHGGAEGSSALHVADSMEVYYNEQRGNVIQFARAMVDSGADIVLGHGPHVPRAINIYKERLIAYSLGNFCTYQGFSIYEEKGIAPILFASLNKDGKFINGKIYSAIQERPYGPVRDESRKAFKLIKKLTQEDFPKSNLFFSNSDKIYNKQIKQPEQRPLYLPKTNYRQTLKITEATSKFTK